MYRVIVAGGIASGKSTFARELERLGALRIDLDELSRVVLDQDQTLVAAIVRRFGDDVVDGTGASCGACSHSARLRRRRIRPRSRRLSCRPSRGSCVLG